MNASPQIFSPGDGYEYGRWTEDDSTSYQNAIAEFGWKRIPDSVNCDRRVAGTDVWWHHTLSIEEFQRIFKEHPDPWMSD